MKNTEIETFCINLKNNGYPVSETLLNPTKSILYPLKEKGKCPNISATNFAYEKALSIDIGWDNRIPVMGLHFLDAGYDTDYVMFKYKDDAGNTKICECIVYDEKIIRIVEKDYEMYYIYIKDIEERHTQTLEKIKMLHSTGFPIHPTLLNSIPQHTQLYRTPNNRNNHEAFLIAKTIKVGFEHAIPVPAAFRDTDYSMFKYLDNDGNEKICSCVIREEKIIHISCFDCEESGYGCFSIDD
jgi:hypothetical protein